MTEPKSTAINCIRFLAADAVEKAASGHPGLPMGGATMAWTLWSRFLQHQPSDPLWPNRDRFVLSAGHGSMLLYSLLHLFGYGLTLDDLENFRQWQSKTPGHPEHGHTLGVETTTGPLGQGFATAVGMAIAEARLAAEFNRPQFELYNHYTYVYAGDGCMMEGISGEAASLAGHLKLGKLICLYDDNKTTIDGGTNLAFGEDVGQRFAAYGWQVLKVADGNDSEAIANALVSAREEKDRPSLVMVRTSIGYGSPNKQGTASAHGAPLGTEELALTRENLNWPHPPFTVPENVREQVERFKAALNEKYQVWQQMLAAYRQAFPDEAQRWRQWTEQEVGPELAAELEALVFAGATPTRTASNQVMQTVSRHVPNLIGGTADLRDSTQAYLETGGVFRADNRQGSNIHFGVREHAMAAISNGLTLHGGLKVFCATYLVFSDYLKPALRLSALMGLPVIYIFTHDSIAVGEDGSTHQPVEHLTMLRSIPNVYVYRPADGPETAAAWQQALARRDGPSVLVLSRQKLPQLANGGTGADKGAYILAGEPDKARLVLMASGSEVHLALGAREALAAKGIESMVVSVLCQERFADQSPEYRGQILPNGIPRLAVEAGHPLGWGRLVGTNDRVIGVSDFGASAPGPVLLEKLGFSVDNIVQTGLAMTKKAD